MSKTEHTGGRVLLALGVLLAALFILSFRLGRYGVDAGTTCRILLSRLLPLEQTWTGNEYTAVLNIRLPRIVLACLVGCCLSSAGAAYQGVFQNPMASPDVLGAAGRRSLLLMDELGFLERCSPVFQRAVFTLLDGPTPVLGVLRRHAKSPFWGPVSRRADVRLLPLTVENRAEIPTELARLLG